MRLGQALLEFNPQAHQLLYIDTTPPSLCYPVCANKIMGVSERERDIKRKLETKTGTDLATQQDDCV